MKNIATGQNGIVIDGIYEYPIKPTFFIKVILSLSNLAYEEEKRDYEELKNEYISKLVDEGLMGNDSGTISEDNLAYGTMNFEKQGTVLEYKTNSIDKMEKFLMITSPGVTKSDSMLFVTLTDDERAEYAKKAFENAKEKATRLAKNIGKEIGEPIFIHDVQPAPYMDGFYYNERLQKRDYVISVGFEIK